MANPFLDNLANGIIDPVKNMVDTVVSETFSVKTLTGGKYTTLTYNASSSNNPNGSFVQVIEATLAKCGYPVNRPPVQPSGVYDYYVQQAVKKFQEDHWQEYKTTFMTNSGSLDDDTWRHILKIANEQNNDTIEEDPTETEDTDSDSQYSSESSDSPHYNPYFDKDNGKQFRKNHKDIRIIFGESGIVKTLHDVVMRSVGIEVDTSGNPISETYEFIARDVTETDESRDEGKYENENGVSSSDIQYKFNFDFDK